MTEFRASFALRLTPDFAFRHCVRRELARLPPAHEAAVVLEILMRAAGVVPAHGFRVSP